MRAKMRRYSIAILLVLLAALSTAIVIPLFAYRTNSHDVLSITSERTPRLLSLLKSDDSRSRDLALTELWYRSTSLSASDCQTIILSINPKLMNDDDIAIIKRILVENNYQLDEYVCALLRKNKNNRDLVQMLAKLHSKFVKETKYGESAKEHDVDYLCN